MNSPSTPCTPYIFKKVSGLPVHCGWVLPKIPPGSRAPLLRLTSAHPWARVCLGVHDPYNGFQPPPSPQMDLLIVLWQICVAKLTTLPSFLLFLGFGWIPGVSCAALCFCCVALCPLVAAAAAPITAARAASTDGTAVVIAALIFVGVVFFCFFSCSVALLKGSKQLFDLELDQHL